ncbi:MAG: hypothetical protein KBF71_08860 [Alphaproteobacteria bacterium]|jgi:hypothetical protein|nr:hypothetical protein [Alphaproteobacteria bacterium]
MSFFKHTQKLGAVAPQFFKAETALRGYSNLRQGADAVRKSQMGNNAPKQLELSARISKWADQVENLPVCEMGIAVGLSAGVMAFSGFYVFGVNVRDN